MGPLVGEDVDSLKRERGLPPPFPFNFAPGLLGISISKFVFKTSENVFNELSGFSRLFFEGIFLSSVSNSGYRASFYFYAGSAECSIIKNPHSNLRLFVDLQKF